MAILKTDTRFTIETLIAIARTTSSPTTREALLEEALDVLRTGETANYRNGVEEFFTMWIPTETEPINQRNLYEQYSEYSYQQGLPVIGKQHFYKALRERGFRTANWRGKIMVYIKPKYAEAQLTTAGRTHSLELILNKANKS